VVVLCRNVFCLPGVPELMREQFEALRQKFACKPLYRQHIQVACDEVDIAHVLSEAQQKFSTVKIGSCTAAVASFSSAAICCCDIDACFLLFSVWCENADPVDVPASTPGEETTLKRVRVVVQGRDEEAVQAASRDLD